MAIAERIDFLQEITRLQLFFCWHYQQQNPTEDFSQTLRNRVNIYGQTELFQKEYAQSLEDYDFTHPAWLKLETQLTKMALAHRHDPDATAFEEAAFQLIQPLIPARAAIEAGRPPAVELFHFQCGSLKYDTPTSEHPDLVAFHIANALCPRSIFADPAYLPQGFLCLLDNAEKEYGATRLGTMTWLNTQPKWLALFPAEWQENMEIIQNPRWSLATWGQFINARGGFNAKLGEQMRRNKGRFPYSIGRSICSFTAMREHLTRHFPQTAEKNSPT